MVAEMPPRWNYNWLSKQWFSIWILPLLHVLIFSNFNMDLIYTVQYVSVAEEGLSLLNPCRSGLQFHQIIITSNPFYSEQRDCYHQWWFIWIYSYSPNTSSSFVYSTNDNYAPYNTISLYNYVDVLYLHSNELPI